jgi:UPF0716 protein FxsA
MLFKLILLFTIIPALELYLLISVGSIVGAPITILIIILTGVLGAFLAKKQGLLTMQKALQEFQMGRAPAEELLHGILIIFAGIVLITPGFITDAIGFLLLIPISRKMMFSFLKTKLGAYVTSNSDSENKNTIEIFPDEKN